MALSAGPNITEPTLEQELRKALKSVGAKSLNRIDLYGKNLIPMEKLYNLWGPWPPWPHGFYAYALEYGTYQYN